MSLLEDALQKHDGDIFEICLKEPFFETWPIGDAMRLLAIMMLAIAKKEKSGK